MKRTPRLFGIINSNRDFTDPKSWGKNQFNSSFPASLCCYLQSKKKSANYLSLKNGKFVCEDITINEVFNVNPSDKDTYFAFEAQHSPFQKYVVGALPRTDLVIQKKSTGQCLAGLEIKLTALPDNTTCELKDAEYGSEIVVRPDTIVYLACSLAQGLGSNLSEHLDPSIRLKDWSDASEIIPFISKIITCLKNISRDIEKNQKSFLLQPVWKTMGKFSGLADNCLDVFIWSDAGFTDFITNIAQEGNEFNKISRQTRTAIWLYKMLDEIVTKQSFNHEEIIDVISYNTKNDKAFASSGYVTNHFMKSPRLEKPLITKAEIKKIILGGGQKLLSPERRFDAIISNSPELF